MKIVNISLGAPFTEGYSYQDNLLSEYQKKLGNEVYVIATTLCRGENGKLVNCEEGNYELKNGVKLIRLKNQTKLNKFFGNYKGIYSILMNLQPDLVYVHGLCLNVTKDVIKYKKKTKDKEVKIVADNHQDLGTTKVKGFPFKQQLLYFKFKWKKWIKYVEKVYAVTSWRKTFAQTYYGIPSEKLDILVMGIDVDSLPKDYDATRLEIRKSLSISSDTFTFITGGKLDKHKNVIEMIKAYSKIDIKNSTFIIFGSVAEDIKDEFNSLIKNDNRIKYIGYLSSEEIKKYFISSDFGVFAGRHSVLWEEAIGCSLPCLFKKYEEVDHVEVCGNSISLKEPTVESIYDNLNKVIVDKEYYKKLEEASKKASKEFSYLEIAKKSLECLND